jgi:hypothetical protein
MGKGKEFYGQDEPPEIPPPPEPVLSETTKKIIKILLSVIFVAAAAGLMLKNKDFFSSEIKNREGSQGGEIVRDGSKIIIRKSNPNVDISLKSDPTGAAVEFQGLSWGHTPLKLVIPHDKVVDIKVKSKGYKTVEIKKGFKENSELFVELKR